MERIEKGKIRLGEALPWPVVDENGILLLRRGYVIDSQSQLDALIERGVYISSSFGSQPSVRAAPVDDAKPSPFHLLENLQMRLRNLCENLKSAVPGELSHRLVGFCQDLQRLCEMHPDPVLGAVHLMDNDSCSPHQDLHVAILAGMIARVMDIAEDERLSIVAAALTHDLGIIDMQKELHKQSTPLSEAQWTEIRQHPARSVAKLRALGVTDEVWLEAVLHHHERLDGSGYPDGLREAAISIPARLIGIADIYCAMIKPRAYREPYLAKHALRDIFLKQAGHIDVNLAKIFIKELGVYPPGTFVKLHNSEVAVVTHRGQNGSCPIAYAVIGPRGAPLSRPIRRDTSLDEFKIRDMVMRDKAASISLPQLWDSG